MAAVPSLIRSTAVDTQLALIIHMRVVGAGLHANRVDTLRLELAHTKRVIRNPDAGLLLPQSWVVECPLVEAGRVAVLCAGGSIL